MKFPARFMVTFIAIVTILGLIACVDDQPKNPFVAPELNTTVESSMQRRTRGEPDNYKETCIHLNDTFKYYNTCSLSVQTDLSINGTQVTDQKSEFTKLPNGSTLTSFNLESGTVGGDTIEANDVKVGDVWHFHKINSDVEYEMVFEILEVEENSIKVQYQVTSFKQLW